MDYYNEIDPAAAEWLRELIKAKLIPEGEVDERSVKDVQAADLAGFRQCHFFAGIGGWALALRLAGWPDDRPVWTGSCPCQPYSAAGKQKGDADERNLWPDFFGLIKACRPPVVWGEQVASAEIVGSQLEADFIVAVQTGKFARANKLAKRLARSSSFHFHRRWVDGVRADVEAENYAFRSAVLGAHSVGSPHIRQRLFWVADAELQRTRSGDGQERASEVGRNRPAIDGTVCGLAHSDGGITGHRGLQPGGEHGQQPQDGGTRERLGNPSVTGLEGHAGNGDHGDEPGRERAAAAGHAPEASGVSGVGDADRVLAEQFAGEGRFAGSGEPVDWSDCRLIVCRDGKARRIPVEPALFPLADGIPGRVGLLRGAGNAICPQTAAAFIEAVREEFGV